MNGLVLTSAKRREPLWNKGISPVAGMVFLAGVALASAVGWNALAAAVYDVRDPTAIEQGRGGAGAGAAAAPLQDEMAAAPNTTAAAPDEPEATSPRVEPVPSSPRTEQRGDGTVRPPGHRREPRGTNPSAAPGARREVVGASDREDPLDGLDFGNLAG